MFGVLDDLDFNIMEYGYLDEHGYLHSREATDQEELYTDEAGEQQRRVIPAEQVVKTLLASGWKPVKEIDESNLATDEDYVVRVVPNDAGDCIDFRYERVFDRKKFLTRIQRYKDDLAGSDYKITKCYEASLMGDEPPYDIAALRQERQSLRAQINELEKILSENE
jgi:hypothetical protein